MADKITGSLQQYFLIKYWRNSYLNQRQNKDKINKIYITVEFAMKYIQNILLFEVFFRLHIAIIT